MADEAKGGAYPKRAWGAPLVRLDERWTRLEAWTCVVALAANVLALCVWVLLSGLSSEGNSAGGAFRALAGATVLGIAARVATRSRPEAQRAAVVTGAAVLGLLTYRLWAHAGVTYTSNVLNWIQNASVLMLFGGLRSPGLATRLTLWLALLGASIATAQGKHINVDVVMRFLSPRARVPVAVVGWLAATVTCLAGAVGFVDHIAIQGFHARADQSFPEKVALVEHGVKNDLFLLGRQASLDVRTLPRVLAGTPYNGYMRPAEWNAWLAEAPWAEHYKAEDVQALVLPPEGAELAKMPAVSVPGGGEDPRGLLTKDLDFIFAFGLAMIALRFVLRSLLAVSGQITVDPDAAHGEPDVASHHVPPPPPSKREVAS